MIKQILSKSVIVLAVMFFASSVTQSFAQQIAIAPSLHTLSAGDPGGGAPDPTGGNGNPGNGIVAVHLR